MKNKRSLKLTFLSLFLVTLFLASAAIMILNKATGAFADGEEANLKLGADMKINAKSALLMDYNTGTVVFNQNADERLPIASMVKIMTLNIVFAEMKEGRLNRDDMINASENAASMGGSQAFLDANAEYKLDELIKSIVVASANDSCVAVAEHIAGSVDGFVNKMNEKAAALGMTNTNFVNCTGLPAPNQYCTANDVGIMTREMLSNEIFFEYASVWMFDFMHPGGRFTSLSNTNKLLKGYPGCDGGKTGFTNEAMYCLSATAKRGQTRFISVVMGAETSKIRNGENSKLFNYGFANFETKQFVVKGAGNDKEYEVSKGKQKTLKLLPNEDFYYFAPKNTAGDISYETEIESLVAPIQTSQKLGSLVIKLRGEEIGRVSLVSDREILKESYLDIIDKLVSEW